MLRCAHSLLLFLVKTRTKKPLSKILTKDSIEDIYEKVRKLFNSVTGLINKQDSCIFCVKTYEKIVFLQSVSFQLSNKKHQYYCWRWQNFLGLIYNLKHSGNGNS